LAVVFRRLIMTIYMYYLTVKHTEVEENESLYNFDLTTVTIAGCTYTKSNNICVISVECRRCVEQVADISFK
jgi:hypothetical protein